MNPGNSQFADWERGGKTVPGALDDLGRKTHRITVLNPDFWDTEPVPMDAQEMRRDAIAAASQAPRVHRVTGTSNQGRVVHVEGGLPPTDPIADLEELGHSVALWIGSVVVAILVTALVLRITWADVISLLAVIGGA